MANNSRKPRRGLRRIIPTFKQLTLLAIFGIVAVVLTIATSVKVLSVPQPNEVTTAQTTILYYDDGVTELGRLGEANRVSVPIDEVPLLTQRAVLAAEDRQFYEHDGFSIRGIARALYTN